LATKLKRGIFGTGADGGLLLHSARQI